MTGLDLYKALGGLESDLIERASPDWKRKEKADFITKTNDEDGVKYALEHLEKEFNKN